ncbi:hypothetical protein BDW62DRAFT_149879 [Aspergillus aurantiobrunneus]
MANWANIPANALGFVKSLLLYGSRTAGERQELRSRLLFFFLKYCPSLALGSSFPKSRASMDGYYPISIHATHSDIVKFRSAEDSGSKRLLNWLVSWETQVFSDLNGYTNGSCNERRGKRKYNGSDRNYRKCQRPVSWPLGESPQESDESHYDGSSVFDDEEDSPDEELSRRTDNPGIYDESRIQRFFDGDEDAMKEFAQSSHTTTTSEGNTDDETEASEDSSEYY